ncbi:MAG: PepSY-like domain-containing protein [Flavobacteriales bacterium]|nr:PepSY-like domain-containing protein [Flavobacteriales bacterium]MCB9192118.1 PepSY-like domain-containing protein [Flavobacteriales bacterium]MCB9203804.1 PepSY-like domain-containing protein [Flavobacteriales bacterium]
MKRSVILFICFLIVGAGCVAQNIDKKDVPTHVMEAFRNKIPNVSKQAWEMKEGIYQVMFKQGEHIGLAKFDKEGIWIQTNHRIRPDEFPKTSLDQVRKHYPRFKIEKVYRVETAKGQSFFTLELEKEFEEIEVTLYPDGRISDTGDLDEDEDEEDEESEE